MKRSEDDKAMSLIRRAAALMNKDGKVCTTPGCRYTIRMADNYVACSVRLPDDLGMTVAEVLGELPYLREFWEEEVHDMMANAVEKVIAGVRSAKLTHDVKTFWKDNPGAKVLSDDLLTRLNRKEPHL